MKYFYLLVTTIAITLNASTWLTSQQIKKALRHKGSTINQTKEWLDIAEVSLYCLPRPVISLTPINLPHHENPVERKKIINDFLKIKSLAWAYCIYHKQIFLTQCENYLLSWQAKFNLIEQKIFTKDCWPIIELIEGYSLIENCLPIKTRKRVVNWLASILKNLTVATNNNWELAQMTTLQLALGYSSGCENFILSSAQNLYKLIDDFQINICDFDKNLIEIIALIKGAIILSQNDQMCSTYLQTLKSHAFQLINYLSKEIPGLFLNTNLCRQLLSEASYFWPETVKIRIKGHIWSTANGYTNALNNND